MDIYDCKSTMVFSVMISGHWLQRDEAGFWWEINDKRRWPLMLYGFFFKFLPDDWMNNWINLDDLVVIQHYITAYERLTS